MKKTLLVLVVSSVLLSGCVIAIGDDEDYGNKNGHVSWSELEKENREQISRLSIGASITSVKSKLGVPEFDELLMKNGTEYRVIYYRTHRVKGDSMTTKNECTPIVFVNGELSGYGQAALDII